LTTDTGRKRVPAPSTGRRARRQLDEQEIVQAALSLIRRNGLQNLSMRTLADELGVTTMAAYHHVRSKEALLEMVADAILSTVSVPPEDFGDWVDRVVEMHRRMTFALLECPGMSNYLMSRPLTTAGRHIQESTRTLLADAGLSPKQVALTAAFLQAFVLGRLGIEAAVGSRAHRAAMERRQGVTVGELFDDGFAKVALALRASVSA